MVSDTPISETITNYFFYEIFSTLYYIYIETIIYIIGLNAVVYTLTEINKSKLSFIGFYLIQIQLNYLHYPFFY